MARSRTCSLSLSPSLLLFTTLFLLMWILCHPLLALLLCLYTMYINAAAAAVVDVDVDVASSLTLPKAVARSKATSAATATATSALLG